MPIAMKTIAILTFAISLGNTSNTHAAGKADCSLHALKREVTELKTIVKELGKCIKNLENRLQALERAMPQRDNLSEPQFPIDVEIGTWIDDLQMQQKPIQRFRDEGVIRPVEPAR